MNIATDLLFYPTKVRSEAMANARSCFSDSEIQNSETKQDFEFIFQNVKNANKGVQPKILDHRLGISNYKRFQKCFLLGIPVPQPTVGSTKG